MEVVMEAQAVLKNMRPGRLEFSVAEEIWPLEKPFRISRGTRTEARVIVVTITDGEHTGRGEAVPSKRYGETVASATAQLKSIFAKGQNIDRADLQKLLPPGPARNALDCALWDLEAKRSGKRVWEFANIPVVDQAETAFTISLDAPEKMATDAKVNAAAPILKLKLGGDDRDLARVEAVRQKAPDARLLIDANESWSPSHYGQIVSDLARLGVELIEQPFPADEDEVLETLDHPVPVCADESCHTTADLPRLARRYEAINVKLDKTGGLTEALRLTASAREMGHRILFGCMVCTSLGIAPARLLVRAGDYVDLDGPLLVAKDRPHGLRYENGKVGLPSRELWG
jgi:L-alanine-DL-glutamate epimerase-like enolase superfamily enzyme